jgi:hypothetical protein
MRPPWRGLLGTIGRRARASFGLAGARWLRQVRLMSSKQDPVEPAAPEGVDKDAAEKRPLTPAAERALAEAAARRAERERLAGEQPKEMDGRGGLDPTRYGDWEINGLTSDF